MQAVRALTDDLTVGGNGPGEGETGAEVASSGLPQGLRAGLPSTGLRGPQDCSRPGSVTCGNRCLLH